MEIGIQISSIRSLIQTPEGLRDACEKFRESGCRTLQLQWLGREIHPETVRQILEETGIRSVSVQDFYLDVKADPDYYIALNRATGGRWLTVSRIPEYAKSPQGLEVFIRELEELQQRLVPLGQTLCFHPVTADYRAVEGMDAVGCLLERLPWLELCLDLFHLNRNCADMPEFIRRYAGRIPLVHFKDEDAFGSLVPAGQGVVHWDGVAEACGDAGVLWGFAEQETWDRDPFACLEEAMAWICSQL